MILSLILYSKFCFTGSYITRPKIKFPTCPACLPKHVISYTYIIWHRIGQNQKRVETLPYHTDFYMCIFVQCIALYYWMHPPLHALHRNPTHSQRPPFSEISATLNGSSSTLLLWTGDDRSVVGELGDQLSEAQFLYQELQNTYLQ